MCYGVRLRMLHERQAIWGESKDFNPEAFCWIGDGTAKDRTPMEERNRDDGGVTNVLVAKIMAADGKVDVDELLKVWHEWKGIPMDEGTAGE